MHCYAASTEHCIYVSSTNKYIIKFTQLKVNKNVNILGTLDFIIIHYTLHYIKAHAAVLCAPPAG